MSNELTFIEHCPDLNDYFRRIEQLFGTSLPLNKTDDLIHLIDEIYGDGLFKGSTSIIFIPEQGTDE